MKTTRVSPYEQMKAAGQARIGRPRTPGLSDDERADRKRLQALFGSTARGRALAVLAAKHADEYDELLALEKAWLAANDDRFESIN